MKLILCLAFLLVTQSLGAPDGKRDWMKTLGARAKPEIRMPRLRTEDGKLNIDSRIVGGVEATPHEFPWAVTLDIDNKSFCTGSLISNEWVVTAGHCVNGAKSIVVTLGAHNISAGSDELVKKVQVPDANNKGQIIRHENYDAANIANDIGLIQLPAPITLNDKIAAIKLNDNASIPAEGDYVTAAGWGRYSDAISSISPVLREVQVPVMSNADCKKAFNIVTDGNICINGTGGHGTCNGDSGGPLMVGGGVGTNSLLVGITSFGSSRGCEKGYPDVFTSVSFFRDWIKTHSGV